MSKTFDVIVIGLGAMGSASTYQLAKRGLHVLGIDQYAPPHTLGSSHGDTRITRLAIGEGEAYVPIVLRSHEIWRELEAETNKDIYTACGGLTLASNSHAAIHHGKEGFFDTILKAAKRYDIKHEQLSVKDVEKRFPHFTLKGDEDAYYESDAGFVRPENAIAAQLLMAERLGASLNLNEQILAYDIKDSHVSVTTNKGHYEAEQLVLSAGAWIPDLLDTSADIFTIYRQVLYWFETEQAPKINAAKSPVFIWLFGESDEDYFYGFPSLEGENSVKVATGHYQNKVTPQTIDRQVSQEETDFMYDYFVANRLKNISRTCLKSAACMYTTTPDGDFVIDQHPESDRVMVVSACSGHGFKHSAGIGEAVAQLVSNQKSTYDLSSFSLKRFKD